MLHFSSGYVYFISMKRFIITLVAKKHDRLKVMAKEEGISMTELIRRIIDAFLEKSS